MHIEIIITLAVAIFGSTGFWTIISKLMDRKSDSGKLLMGIAYDNIIYQCEKYIAQGFIKPEDYKELDKYLFQPYKHMGGNGTAAKLMGEVSNLPSKPAE